MNQEDLLFMVELTQIARRPDAVKRLSTDKELINRIVEMRQKYGRKQFDEVLKLTNEGELA